MAFLNSIFLAYQTTNKKSVISFNNNHLLFSIILLDFIIRTPMPEVCYAHTNICEIKTFWMFLNISVKLLHHFYEFGVEGHGITHFIFNLLLETLESGEILIIQLSTLSHKINDNLLFLVEKYDWLGAPFHAFIANICPISYPSNTFIIKSVPGIVPFRIEIGHVMPPIKYDHAPENIIASCVGLRHWMSLLLALLL